MSLFAQYLQNRNQVSLQTQSLDQDGIFTNTKKSEFAFDPDKLLERARKGEKLEENAIKVVCSKVKEIFMKEDNVCILKSPITLVGDVHGQFYDVLELFRVGGDIPDTNYLFMGDYVDRGAHSVETISLLMLLKLRYPHRICLIRGNHETRQITQIYGFYTECQSKYGNPRVWQLFTDVFDYLPIAAIIDDKVFCVHGGLSPTVHHIDDIKQIQRVQEIPHEGPFADLMWSDPDGDKPGFSISARGAGYIFGEDVCLRFLQENDMNRVYRAHQLCKDGYLQLFGGKLATVWSAPNYCHRYENLASILELDEHLNEYFNIFEDAPENSREKKVDKERDVYSFIGSESTKGSSRMSQFSSSHESGGGKKRGGREDFFI